MAPAPPVPPEELLGRYEAGEARDLVQALLQLNQTDVPFQVVDGLAEGVDLIAEWRLVDAKWRDLAMANQVKRVFRIFLKLHPAEREIRAVDRAFSLSWSAGIPVFESLDAGATGSAEFFRGQQTSAEFEMSFRVEDVLAFLLNLLRFRWVPPKPIYAYHFDTSKIKDPIKEVIARSGWTYHPVAFGSL